MQLLYRINRAGTTILMATHDREMVDKMRKRVIALEEGKLAPRRAPRRVHLRMSRFKLIVSEAVRSLGANLSTTFAAATTVLIGMFMLGLVVGLGSWALSLERHYKKQLLVKVYFCTTLALRHRGEAEADGRTSRTRCWRSRESRRSIHLEGGGARDHAQEAIRR